MHRPRAWAVGLRGRIVGALLFTTIATLGVAAVALLGPLERQLRSAELRTLSADVRAQLQSFTQLSPGDIDSGLQSRPANAPRHALELLKSHVGGEATLLAYPRTVIATNDPVSADDDRFSDVTTAFQTGRVKQGFGTSDGTEVAEVAVPFTLGSRHAVTTGPQSEQTYVLAVRKPIPEVTGAVQVVRRAFLTAAIAGLLLTLVLGIAIAATLVRRLRRLRQAALQLAEGGPLVDIPHTRTHDEVEDLSKTFEIMQQRLQHQEQARRAFVATASHELRTPLTSLDGMLELLDDDLRSGDPDLADALVLLQRARAQSRRLARLANDLLDLSKLDAEVKLRSEPVELSELGRAVLAEFELGTSDRGVTPVLDDGGSQVWALADPGSVAQILRILLDNAFRVSPVGGEVRVELRSGDVVALRVRDQGPGVPSDEREMIFERFKRGSGTGGQGGFGLGLAIGRELAERMGGSLELEDQTSWSGASFVLRLRAAPARVAAAAAAS